MTIYINKITAHLLEECYSIVNLAVSKMLCAQTAVALWHPSMSINVC